MIVTNDAALADRLRRLRQYGWQTRDASQEPGLNSRLDELQAAILRVKLRHLDAWQARRAALAARYNTGLAAGAPWLTLPPTVPRTVPAWHLYAVRTPARDDLRRALAAAGIGTGVHYPLPAHRQPGYARAVVGPGGLAASERWAAEVLSLPLHPFLREDEVDWVVAAISGYEGRRA
jgi:dTDP-4-amino-4,6-dideoxygalactose transaminase